jgi:macrolide-specific efflux system membrane fusion protein
MKSKTKVFIILIIIIIGAALLIIKSTSDKKSDVKIKEISPVTGNIMITVSINGEVLPKNRLEVMPSVAGRIEKVLVQEGDKVKVGQVLAIMSSADRAALIDAARLQGADAIKYWENAYKAISIVSPINGTVIVRSVEPGQTVTTTNNIMVISDRLIIKAQADETDIAKINKGQSAYITLDSHPEILVKGKVTHIYYESTIVNNVTVYYLIITPDTIPPEYRSGMSASIEVVEKENKNVILIPRDAVITDTTGNYVIVKKGDNMPPEKRAVSLGLTNDTDIEITGGIGLNDVILVSSVNILNEESSSGSNPFMPARPGRKEQ